MRVTPFMLLLGCFAALLGRYSGQEDVAIGVPVSARDRPGLDDTVGFLVNTVVLRIGLEGSPTFAGVLGRVRDVTTGALRHADAPFERVVEEMRPDRDLSLNPLFQVMFTMEGPGERPPALGGAKARRFPVRARSAHFDLTPASRDDLDDL